MKKVHVIYDGTVQGVGFRFTAQKTAVALGITGYVLNLPDGRVEAVCEGAEEDLTAFLQRMDASMEGYISGKETDWDNSASGSFTSFDIRF